MKTTNVILIIIIAILIILLGWSLTRTPSETKEGPIEIGEKVVADLAEYKNNDHGFSFNYTNDYAKEIRESTPSLLPSDKGKIMGGYLTNQELGFHMTIGAVTPVFSAPIELNANEVNNYPTTSQLQSLSERGYRNEKRINSQGEEYVLIYGQKEVDMPYIGENQAVAIFRLKSSPDFKALGFMLLNGDLTTFLEIMDSVKVF